MPTGATRPPSSTEAGPQRPAEDQVLGQVLEQHFGAYQRALLIASLFALLSVWLLRHALPPLFLAAWVAYFVGINVVRIVMGRSYRQAPESSRDEQRWRVVALTAHATGGSAWGILGAATIMFKPESPEYTLLFFFIFALFATFQVANPSRYPPAYYAWVGTAMGPTLVAAAAEHGVYRSVAGVEGDLRGLGLTLVRRHSHRLMMDAFAKQVERTRLLEPDRAEGRSTRRAAPRRASSPPRATTCASRCKPWCCWWRACGARDPGEPQNRRAFAPRSSRCGAPQRDPRRLKFDAGTVRLNARTFPWPRCSSRLRTSFSYRRRRSTSRSG